MTTPNVVLATLILYKLVLMGIGLWASRRNRSEADFFLGGRGLGAFVAGLSYAASTSSAWVLLGFSGFVYATGLSALWMAPGIWAGYAVVWLYFGPRLRRESSRHNQLTATDFVLQDAARHWRGLVAAVAALLIVGCFVFYIAAQFDAAGKALAEHFALSVGQAVVLGAVIVAIYSLLGGFWAVSITDTLQAAIMMLVAIGVPIAALVAAGGPDSVWDSLVQTVPPAYLEVTGGHAGLVFVGFVLGVIGMSLGTFGQPHLLARLMAVKDERERRRGFAVVFVWGVVVISGMAVLGLAGRALFPDLVTGEVLFYRAAAEHLPGVLAGIVVAATLSAVMSTVDSILLAASGAVAHDLGVNRRFPRRELLISRSATFAVAALAVALTLSLPDSIFNRVLFAWSALGAAFGPLVLWRVSGQLLAGPVALGSMLAGFATTVLFYALGAAPATDGLLSQAAYLPGDPFERIVPWLPSLLILILCGRGGSNRMSIHPKMRETDPMR